MSRVPRFLFSPRNIRLRLRTQYYYQSLEEEDDVCMGYAGSILILVNLFFTVIIGLYFLNLLRGQQSTKGAVDRESRKQLEQLRKLRRVSLTEPLSEKTRPRKFDDIVGQTEALRALRAALCGPNPQHVILYGPPGVGKTAAARLVVEEAKTNPLSPFNATSQFIELDATTARFDERGIADPLIGSVHDPIYQGAGAMGVAGIPQPKPGAVTKAHGGVLFIDEIGELHPTQMNKLLKVLEDRKVFLESAYYSSEDNSLPTYIHEVFSNGLPADFRLIGATTCLPQSISPALRSRCVEIFFRSLSASEIEVIALNAAQKIDYVLERVAIDLIKRHCSNGRETVNMIQIASGIALSENRRAIGESDVEWVIRSGEYTPRIDQKIAEEPQVGLVNGLAVYGPNAGTLIEIEVCAVPVEHGKGEVITTGVVEEEETKSVGMTLRRKSMVKGAIENVMTVLKKNFHIPIDDYCIHINFPGGVPIDGPSAGIALVTATYSAIRGIPIDNYVAMTGEVSLRGVIKAVGGVPAKISAACEAGVKRIYIPKENWQHLFAQIDGVKVIPVLRIEQVIDEVLLQKPQDWLESIPLQKGSSVTAL